MPVDRPLDQPPDPATVWAATLHAEPVRRRQRPSPDEDDFTTVWNAARWRWLPMLFPLGLVLLMAWFTGRGSGVAGVVRTASIVLVAIVLVGWAWSSLTRASRRRRDWDAFGARGFIAERHRTGLTEPDGSRRVWLLLDTRITDRQAARIHRSVSAWLPSDGSDGDRRTSAVTRIALGNPLPTEDVFGPQAAGGYLLLSATDDRWTFFVPRDRDRWHLVHGTSVSGEERRYHHLVLDAVEPADPLPAATAGDDTAVGASATDNDPPAGASAAAALVRAVDTIGAIAVTLGAAIGWIVLGMKASRSRYWADNICAVPSCELGPTHGDALVVYGVILSVGLVAGIIVAMLDRHHLTRIALVIQVAVAVAMVLNTVLAPHHVPAALRAW